MSDPSKNIYTGDDDFDELIDRALRILKTKSVDYAEEGDRLAEIRSTAEECGITMRQALGVYMSKHLRSIKKWIKGKDLKGEPVEEKFLDNLVYSLIGFKLAKEERSSTQFDYEKEKELLAEENKKLSIDFDSDYTCPRCDNIVHKTSISNITYRCDDCELTFTVLE